MVDLYNMLNQQNQGLAPDPFLPRGWGLETNGFPIIQHYISISVYFCAYFVHYVQEKQCPEITTWYTDGQPLL